MKTTGAKSENPSLLLLLPPAAADARAVRDWRACADVSVPSLEADGLRRGAPGWGLLFPPDLVVRGGEGRRCGEGELGRPRRGGVRRLPLEPAV